MLSGSEVLAPHELEAISQYTPQVNPEEYDVYVFEVKPMAAPRINWKDKKLMSIPEKLIKDPGRQARRRRIERYFVYKRTLQNLAKIHKYDMQIHNWHIIFHIPMPESWSVRKKQYHLGGPHQTRPDVDNLLKGFMDAMKKEDMMVFDVRMSKFWSEKGAIEIRQYKIE